MRVPDLRPHVTAGAYLCLLSLLLASLLLASGTRYLHYLVIFLCSLLTAYVVCWRLSGGVGRVALGARFELEVARDWIAAAVLSLAIAFVVAHMLRLGGIPVVQGMLEKDYYAVMLIRQDIFRAELSATWKYVPNVLVKSVFPFLVFYFLARRRPLLLLVTALAGGAYAISLMNKLFIVLLVIPAMAYALASRRWLALPGLAVVPLLGLAFLIQVQNPHLQSRAFVAVMDALIEHTDLELDQDQRTALLQRSAAAARSGSTPLEGDDLDALGSGGSNIRRDHSIGTTSMASDTLRRRVLLVPGQVMTAWFEHVPARLPFARGCGYRWMAPLLGCEYVAYAIRINDIENPELAAKGVQGSMTAASFVEDYANFGLAGLVAAGAVLGLIFVVIGRLFGTDWKANLALNAIPLILLLEIPLTTVILTGGWFVTLLLYLLLIRQMLAQNVQMDRNAT